MKTNCHQPKTGEWILTPTLKRALTGLWSLVCRSMWLRYLSCFTLLPLHRILSHQAGTRHFPLQESPQFSDERQSSDIRYMYSTTHFILVPIYWLRLKRTSKFYSVFQTRKLRMNWGWSMFAFMHQWSYNFHPRHSRPSRNLGNMVW